MTPEKQKQIDEINATKNAGRYTVPTRDSLVTPTFSLAQRRAEENALREDALRRNRVRDWCVRRQQPIPSEYLTEAERAAQGGNDAA
jgi:hypothetical protein